MPRCPSCQTPLTLVERENLQMDSCSNCFGTWISATALKRSVERQPEAGGTAEEISDLAAVVSEGNTKEVLRCPECAREMVKDTFHPRIPITIDRCPRCKGVWLDVGELSLLHRLYHEWQTSSDPEVVKQRNKMANTAEKIATLQVQAQQQKAELEEALERQNRGRGRIHIGTGGAADLVDMADLLCDIVRLFK